MIDFIVIGSMKSGTTTLNGYLGECPNIQMFNWKESQFFSTGYDKGIDYYNSLFKDDNRLKGEASTCYSRFPAHKDVPERIYNYNPNVKLIYLLRNPVDRAYSHYCHNILTDNINYNSFDEALNLSNEILVTSKYMMQLDCYLEYFSKEQIHLVDFDELKNNPTKVISDILLFLECETNDEEIVISQKVNTNSIGSARARKNFHGFVKYVRSLPIVYNIINRLIPKAKRETIRNKIVSTVMATPILKIYQKRQLKRLTSMNDDIKRRLLIEFKDDTLRLEKFWNKDLSAWMK